MVWKRLLQPSIRRVVLLAPLSVVACATIPSTDPLLPVLSFEPGHNFAGSFFNTETLAKNERKVVSVLALPVETQIGRRMLEVECGVAPRRDVRAPNKLIVAWNVVDSRGAPLEAGEVKLKILADGTCRKKSQVLDLGSFPAGSMVEVAVTAKGRPLERFSQVAYEVGVS